MILLLSQMGSIALQILWLLIHLIISISLFLLGIADAVESYLISSGSLKRYKSINVGKLRYLAIVVDSEDARQITQVLKLLQWLTDIGVKHVCLYDSEGKDISPVMGFYLHFSNLFFWLKYQFFLVTGVLKKSKDMILENLSRVKLFEVL